MSHQVRAATSGGQSKEDAIDAQKLRQELDPDKQNRLRGYSELVLMKETYAKRVVVCVRPRPERFRHFAHSLPTTCKQEERNSAPQEGMHFVQPVLWNRISLRFVI